jgi:hypothetical protein
MSFDIKFKLICAIIGCATNIFLMRYFFDKENVKSFFIFLVLFTMSAYNLCEILMANRVMS